LVVLLDYVMPGEANTQPLQIISRNATLSTRHAYVLLTARASMSMPVLEAAQTLSIPVVRKPFDQDALLVTVAQAQQRLEAR
jgi:CheY-like chemotaxis protein